MWKCADPELERQIRCFPYGECSDVPTAPASRNKTPSDGRGISYGWPTLGQTDLRTNATEPSFSPFSLSRLSPFPCPPPHKCVNICRLFRNLFFSKGEVSHHELPCNFCFGQLDRRSGRVHCILAIRLHLPVSSLQSIRGKLKFQQLNIITIDMTSF
jgi:hypothetical protein